MDLKKISELLPEFKPKGKAAFSKPNPTQYAIGEAAFSKPNPTQYAIGEARRKLNVTDTKGRNSWGGWWGVLKNIPWDTILQLAARAKSEGRHPLRLFFYLVNQYKYGKHKRKS